MTLVRYFGFNDASEEDHMKKPGLLNSVLAEVRFNLYRSGREMIVVYFFTQ